jgi:hypothetical protein
MKGYRKRTMWLAQGKPPAQPLPKIQIERELKNIKIDDEKFVEMANKLWIDNGGDYPAPKEFLEKLLEIAE